MILNIAMLAARLLLAGVFAIAGWAKLLDPAGSRQALHDFAVPAPLVPLGAVLLPLAECAIALGLLPLATAWPASIGALLLLAIFVTAIGVSLAHGRKPDCHCFGQLHAEPAGASTLIRNAVLAACAGFLIITGRESAGLSLVGGFAELSSIERITVVGLAILLCVGAIQAALIYQLVRQQGRLLLRLEGMERPLGETTVARTMAAATDAPPAGLAIGTEAPHFELESVHGGKQSLPALLKAGGKPLLLLFTNPNCGPCMSLMPEIASWQADDDLPLGIVLISEGKLADNLAKISGMPAPVMLLQREREVAEAYQAYGTPAAVLVMQDGTIGSALAMGIDPVRALLLEAIDLLGAGQLAPPPVAAGLQQSQRSQGSQTATNENNDISKLALRNAEGNMVSLASLQGKPTMLLFWNSSCGFCQQMLADLRRWDAAPPTGAPDLIIVAAGTEAQHATMGLRAPIMTDPDSSVRTAFGAHGTPMAVLLAETVRMPLEVAAGAQAVFALAGAKLAEAA